MRELLIDLAYNFVGFLLRNLKSLKNIKKIILFGSVVRGDINEESDIDIFVDVYEEDKELEKELFKLREEFYETKKYETVSKVVGERNINLLVGKLNEWELKDTIQASSITLFMYGIGESFKPYFLIYFEPIREAKKIVLLHRALKGYKYRGKFYKPKIKSKIVGRGFVLVDRENYQKLISMLYDLKIPFKVQKIYL